MALKSPLTQTTAMMDWSNELCMHFISLYEKHPVIWNPCHPGNKNRHTVAAAWKAIQDQLNVQCSIIELKRKKESLMASYRTCLAKVRSSSQAGAEPYKPSWFAFEKMDKFLRERNRRFDPALYAAYQDQEFVEPSYVEIDEDNYDTTEPLTSLNVDPTEPDSENNTFPENNIVSHLSNFETPVSPRPAKRFRSSEVHISTNHNNSHETFHPVRVKTEKFEKSNTQEETEFDIWARSIAHQLNNMELGRALNLQLQIQTLVTNDRLGNEIKKEKLDGF